MYRKFLLLGLTACLCGCVRPAKYQRPVPPVPNAWPDSAAAEAGSTDAPVPAETKWQEFFTEPGLQSVIQLALANNRDLRLAGLNVERVQAMYRIQSSQQYPSVGVAASRDFSRLPGKMSPTGEAQTVEQHVNLGSVSWELDFFGRIRSLKSAALEQYLATEQARSATQITLLAAVANSYLALAADRENLRLAQETLNTQRASYELIQRTRDAGIASDLDLRQAQSQVESARADIARYSGRVDLDKNALDLLVGAPAPANLLPAEMDYDRALKDVAAGLPSDVLLRRPDILNAEHQLKAANANIGAARAALRSALPVLLILRSARRQASEPGHDFVGSASETIGQRSWAHEPCTKHLASGRLHHSAAGLPKSMNLGASASEQRADLPPPVQSMHWARNNSSQWQVWGLPKNSGTERPTSGTLAR